MAASTAFAVAGSAVVAPVREGLSSGNAFRTSMVQVAPVRPALKVNRVMAARASLSEDVAGEDKRVLSSSVMMGYVEMGKKGGSATTKQSGGEAAATAGREIDEAKFTNN